MIATVILRGQSISEWNYLNPDEAELMFQARAARHSPVPFSTWITGTTGPVWPLLLAGLNAFGAPLTLAFAHLLAAVLLALTATALFVVASRAIGRGPALLVTIVWWFPIATIFPIGVPLDFGALSTEYLPTLLVVASALVPREQLAVRPWLFVVLGAVAGLAVAAKFQVGPLAAAFAVAQVIALRLSVKRIVVAVLWWLSGAVLPVAIIVLVMVASPTTNWSLVDQTFSFLASYAGGPTTMQKVVRTFTALVTPGVYVLVVLAGVAWLGRHSEKRSNVARVVLIAGGLVSMYIGGMGFPHYLILFFGALGLAATMPLKPDAQLVPQGVAPAVLAGGLAILLAVILVANYTFQLWRPLSLQKAVAAFSTDAVNRNASMARACPPGSSALVWGWAPELHIAQDWQSTVPYANILGLAASPAIRDAAEPVVRAGIDRASCVIDATNLKRPQCPVVRTEQPVGYCLPPTVMLPRIYPQLSALIGRQFHNVPITDGCDGCTFYVRN
ncbi:hypothetical protein [Mycobacterium riyadhense]|uniref:hypothetical protein n=1 Tax=Mycobacterium riyadhense TaxID=486698 RepID=UPI001EFA04C7|nr:hypothetical protein [Mycobacterium riyadhense]